MKVFKIMSSLFILSIVILSCSKETNIENENALNNKSLIYESAQKESGNVYDQYIRVKNEIENNGMPKVPLNQGDFDHLLQVAGYSGNLTLENANEIIDMILTVFENGLNDYIMNNTEFTMFTKEHILLIADVGYVESIEDIPGFNNIPSSEQELLVGANNVSRQFIDGTNGNSNGRFSSGYYVNDQLVSRGLFGANFGGFVGFIGGLVLCGPLCALGGAIVGGIAGDAIENGKG